MTSQKSFSFGDQSPTPEEDIGKTIKATVPNDVPPNPRGNNALPPRTNLDGPPSAFTDQISSSGEPPIAVSGQYIDENDPHLRISRFTVFQDWLSQNSTPLIIIGVAVFIIFSVRCGKIEMKVIDWNIFQ